MNDKGLPGFFNDADSASLAGQKATVHWNVMRLSGLAAGALGGALSWRWGQVEVWGVLALVGFSVALVAEVILLVSQPQRDWYSGRALAESAKTLAWRFAVRADPFFSSLSTEDAEALMRARLGEVAKNGRDRVALSSDQASVTNAMKQLRAKDFHERRRTYVDSRIRDQRIWYSGKAQRCKRLALIFQCVMIAGEILAIVAAALRAFSDLQVDLSGILAALVASGAAWISLRQYSSLASAYSVASVELGLAMDRLKTVDESEWAVAVADAEEAISREHTMWLASRTGAIM